MAALYERNGLDNDELISVVVTATADITTFHPAPRLARSGSTTSRSSAPRSSRSTGRCPAASGSCSTSRPTGPASELRHVFLEGGRLRRTSRTTDRWPDERLTAPAGRGRTVRTASGAEVDRANVVGLGLIGGSVGLALRRAGWHGAPARTRTRPGSTRPGAGASSTPVGLDPDADVTFVATPVCVDRPRPSAGPGRHAAASSPTSAASRRPSSAAVADPRFFGGHPMAGSEQDGLDGADADLFEGAVWVLTPDGRAPPTPRSPRWPGRVGPRRRGGRPAARPPRRARRRGEPRAPPHRGRADDAGRRAGRGARRAAAPGRRRLPGHDPHRRRATRPSGPTSAPRTATPSSTPSTPSSTRLGRCARSWPATSATRSSPMLTRARDARINLPAGSPAAPRLAEVRIAIPDRPGAAAEVSTLAAELGVNVADFEVVHSAEGDSGRADPADRGGAGRPVPGRALARGLPARRCGGWAEGPAVPASTAPRRAADRAAGRGRRRPRVEEHHQPGARVRRAGRRGQHARGASVARTTPRPCSTASRVSAPTSRSTRRRPRRWSWGRRARCGPVRSSSTPAWPARRRASSPRWPRSATAGTGSTAAAAAARARWRRCIDALRRARRRRRAGGGLGPPPGGGRRPAVCRGGAVAVPGRRLEPVRLRPAARRPGHGRGIAVELTTPLVSRPYLGMTLAVMAAFGVDDVAVAERLGHASAPAATAGPTTRSSPTRRRPRTSSRPPPSPAAGCGCPGSGRRRCRATLAFVDLLAPDGCPGRAEPRRHRSSSAPAAPARASTSTWPTFRHRADAGRGGRLRRLAHPHQRASGSSAGRRPTASASLVARAAAAAGSTPTEEADGLTIRPGPAAVHGARVRTYDDHRMAMALRPARPPRRRASRSTTPACVAKTFPDVLAALGSPAPPRLTVTLPWRCGRAGHRHRRPGRVGEVHRGPGPGRAGSASTTSTPGPCTGRSPSPPCAGGIDPDDVEPSAALAERPRPGRRSTPR